MNEITFEDWLWIELTSKWDNIIIEDFGHESELKDNGGF